ncbi:MAG: hypothetical protein ACXAC0_03090 [Candidatus Thorarchaeota archaeon]
MSDEELNEIKQLIDSMQSSLVELFDQLRDLRSRLNIVSDTTSEASPSVLPLFSEVKTPNTDALDTALKPPSEDEEPNTSITESETPNDMVLPEGSDSGNNAKVNRVLDPIAHELRTGEAPAEIVYEYLQAAREYLIDNDDSESQKGKVARDIDIVLNFLKARGKRTIRTDERDNILKRIRRWKAHLAV